MEAAYHYGNEWLDAAMAYIQANLDLVRDRLATMPDVKLIEPEGTFLLWLDLRDLGLPPEELTAFLRKKAKWGCHSRPCLR
jgi:cystathionine beta-lyase